MKLRLSNILNLLACLILRPVLQKSGYFDAAWYVRQYPDVAAANVDPLKHYLLHGWKEGREPGPDFDSSRYVSDSPAGKTIISPLLFYVLIGRWLGTPAAHQTPGEVWWWNSRDFSLSGASPYSINAMAKTGWPVIVVPVFNAVGEVTRCLSSLKEFTPNGCEILVIDDASTDPAIESLLLSYKEVRGVEVVKHEANFGYTATINDGIKRSFPRDVILLNSDTRVGPGWVKHLRWRALSSSQVATVTALSNNSGAFSAPMAGANDLPGNQDLDAVIRAVSQSEPVCDVDVPTGSGFCMYIRRAYLEEVGLFDVDAFPRGYGEENDFCMRGRHSGWRHLIDNKTYVIHERSASFGSEKSTLVATGRAQVDKRYPDYSGLVSKAFSSSPVIKARQEVGRVFQKMALTDVGIKPRVLYTISGRSGGTPHTNQDLMHALHDSVEAFVLQCNSRDMTFYYFHEGQYKRVISHILASPIIATDHVSAEYDQVLAAFLMSWGIELVHIRHLGLHSLGLSKISRDCGIPVLYSLHDFYALCPTVKLIDQDLKFCAGRCTPGGGKCEPELWPSNSFSDLKHNQIHDWQRKLSKSMDHCDGFITTSQFTKDVYLSCYPTLASRPFLVIPHGRDFAQLSSHAVRPESDKPIKIVIPGHLNERKGGHLVVRLAELVPPAQLEIHVLGKVNSRMELPSHVIQHGHYARDQLSKLIKSIGPSLGGIFSIWPETWCHTLTELWACGVPVLGVDIGAVGQRIKESGAGWTVPIDDVGAEQLWRSIQDAVKKDQWRAKIDAVDRWQHGLGKRQSTAWMAQQYLSFYEEFMILDSPRAGIK